MSKTHWKSLMDSNYLGAYSIGDAGDMTVVIDYVVREEVKGAQGKKEDCSVAHLVNQKPMILNATNSKSIARLYGQFVEDWVGKPITLYATTTKMGGEIVECLRVRPKVVVQEKRTITDKGLGRAIAAIKAGTYTTVTLHQEYALTAVQNELVTGELSAAQA